MCKIYIYKANENISLIEKKDAALFSNYKNNRDKQKKEITL